MKKTYGNLFWGLALILIGGFFLAVNMNLFPSFAASIWSMIFGLFSLLFFAGYFLSGVQNWGLLFPAFGSAAIGLTIWLAGIETDGSVVGGLFLVMISIPFWVGYLVNRQQHWGLMIPGWIMGALGLILLLAGRGPGELIGTLVMFAIAIPFLVVYLSDRQNWWALIPAWVMSAIGVIILLANSGSDELIGTLIMFAIALPFFVTYGRNRQNWWAIIPAGVLSSIGVTVLLASLNLSEALQVRLLGGALFAGIGVTFAMLWIRRSRFGTEWAKYPALGLGAAALTILVFGAQVELVWSVVLIGLGLWMLYRAPRPKEKS